MALKGPHKKAVKGLVSKAFIRRALRAMQGPYKKALKGLIRPPGPYKKALEGLVRALYEEH